MADYFDSFGGAALDPSWSVVDWGGFQSATVSGGQLTTSGTGDIFGSANTASAVLRPAPAGPFTATATVASHASLNNGRTLYIASSAANNAANVHVTRVNAGTYTLAWRDANGAASGWTGGSPNGAWSDGQPMALDYDGSQITLLVNGVAVLSHAISWTPGVVGFGIGGGGGTSTAVYDDFSLTGPQAPGRRSLTSRITTPICAGITL